MNQTYRIIPVYTGDVSGVASALYELGGMVVIHDPSGCNSTYNTHDETRWYDKESLIFISGLSERDAILGNDKKLIDDIVTAADELHPKFIALTNSPIPFMSGTDFSAIAKVIEKRTQIPTFYVPANGMHDYTKGAGAAFAALADFMEPIKVASCEEKTDVKVTEDETVRVPINILGATPLDFAAEGSIRMLETLLEDNGFEIIANLGMGEHSSNWGKASKAQVNLVVSATGLALAKNMHKLFGTPYVCGVPSGAFSKVLFTELKKAALTGENRDAFSSVPGNESALKCVLIGEAVAMRSLAAALTIETGINTQAICPLEVWSEILSGGDLHTSGEEELSDVLKKISEDWEKGHLIIVCDPLYEPILPDNAESVFLPHLAFSGRCFVKKRQCIVGNPSAAVEYIKSQIDKNREVKQCH